MHRGDLGRVVFTACDRGTRRLCCWRCYRATAQRCAPLAFAALLWPAPCASCALRLARAACVAALGPRMSANLVIELWGSPQRPHPDNGLNATFTETGAPPHPHRFLANGPPPPPLMSVTPRRERRRREGLGADSSDSGRPPELLKSKRRCRRLRRRGSFVVVAIH